MLHGRFIQLLAVVTTLAASAVLAPVAMADSGTGEDAPSAITKPSPEAPTATDKPVVVEGTAKPVTTDSSPKAPATEQTPRPAAAPPASTPVTAKPATTSSSTAVCTDSSSSGGGTCTPTTSSTTATPATPQEGPSTPNEVPTTTADIPAADRPGGGTELPFTGPGDVVLAIVLALLAGTGGILFMAGATGREELAGLRRRTMDSPSGFKLAYRELLRQQDEA